MRRTGGAGDWRFHHPPRRSARREDAPSLKQKYGSRPPPSFIGRVRFNSRTPSVTATNVSLSSECQPLECGMQIRRTDRQTNGRVGWPSINPPVMTTLTLLPEERRQKKSDGYARRPGVQPRSVHPPALPLRDCLFLTRRVANQRSNSGREASQIKGVTPRGKEGRSAPQIKATLKTAGAAGINHTDPTSFAHRPPSEV